MHPTSSSGLLERVRAYMLQLPRVTETLQWGDNLVYWALDKAVGGKMFALIDMEPGDGPVIAFAAGPERKLHLLEREGVEPAPYLARAHWVALQDWRVLPGDELVRELEAAHAYVCGRLPPRVHRLHELSQRDYRKLVKEARERQKA